MARTTTIDLAPPAEKAFLVAVDTGDDPGWNAQDSLAELASLAETAGALVVGAEWQNRRHVDPNWYVGKGKAEELVAAKAEPSGGVVADRRDRLAGLGSLARDGSQTARRGKLLRPEEAGERQEGQAQARARPENQPPADQYRVKGFHSVGGHVAPRGQGCSDTQSEEGEE